MPKCFKSAAGLITDERFRLRAQIAVAKVASQVILEDPYTEFHVRRVTWAINALKDIVPYTRAVLFVVSSRPDIDCDCADEVLERVIFNSVRVLAGAFTPTPPTPSPPTPPAEPRPKHVIPVVPEDIPAKLTSSAPKNKKRSITDRLLGRNKESK